MILILSSYTDFSTYEVQRWLDKMNTPYIRLNSCNDYKLDINMTESCIITKKGKILLSDIKCVWYRRKEMTKVLSSSPENYQFINDININLLSEEGTAYSSLLSNLKHAFWLNSPKTSSINKFEVLVEANALGIKTPETIISNDYDSIKEFITKHKRVITKNVKDVRNIILDDRYFTSFVNIVDNKDFDNIDKSIKILPSLFQNYIEKKMEIRTVFVNNQFFSMAMFSQSAAQTSVDFRRYDLDKPTRKIPFNLSAQYEYKLRKLFEKVNLNSGSIDTIIGEDNEHIFLEINPIGQFGMTSMPCNYNLEKQFAQHLML